MAENVNNLDKKAIGALLNYSFHIPAYQRGYRWQANYQVKPLLEDIWAYEIDNANPEAFYCLQPVVVKARNENEFELIDGQQRLTTILLILYYFNQTEFKNPKKHYSMQFETRLAQQDFLTIVEDEAATAENIDLFHLHKAYGFIATWFSEKEEQNPAIKSEFYNKLINRTKVIWYEISDQSSVIDIFTRLNIGKIPLTNAELVKALFLSKSNNHLDKDTDGFKEAKALTQINIAAEWDRIEQTLQNEDFWYFICSYPQRYDTRIEYIFDLMMHKPNDEENYYTFYRFVEQFEEEKANPKAINTIWLAIKEYFLSFEEWFNDRELYHLIGYLTAIGKNINALKELSKTLSKTVFKENLKSVARKSIPTNISELNFDTNKKDVRNALLLFNVFTIIENKKCSIRFPFNHYHSQNWDIEHIRSQTSKDIFGKDQLNWAETVLLYFTGILFNGENEAEVIEKCNSITAIEKKYCQNLLQILKKEDENGEVFTKLYDELTTYFKENDVLEDGDNLSNLTLLDEGTNRMYKNAFFPIKRNHIINLEKQGVFIPLCTKNVFLKAYSKKLGEIMYWNNNDADDYLAEISKTLN